MNTNENGETQSKQFQVTRKIGINFSHTFKRSKAGNIHLPFFVIAFGNNAVAVYLLCFSICIYFRPANKLKNYGTNF